MRRRPGMAGVVTLAVALGAVAGCGSKKRQQRSGDAAPVEVIAAPTFASGGDGGVAGTTSDEVEPNDSADVATPLPLAGTIRGTLEADGDADYYRIEVTQAGALAVTTAAVDADLTLELEDASGTSVARSDRGAARVREGVPNLGVRPGRYIAIVKKKAPPAKKRPKGKQGAAPAPTSPVAYELTAQLAVTAANAEHEPDDDRGTSNDLIIGDAASGFVGWSGDTDVWKLSVETLSTKNAIDIEIGEVEGVALALELLDGIGQPLLARKGVKGKPLVVRAIVPVVPSGAPPFHYLTIRGDRSNPETPYQLRVIAKPFDTPDAEAEPNDLVDKPMAFPADRTVVHGAWTIGDVDCYAIAAEVNARTLEVVVDGEPDLSVDLLVDGAVVGKSELKGKGVQEKLAAPVPANATAIIRVRGASDAAGEGTYDLHVREGAASP